MDNMGVAYDAKEISRDTHTTESRTRKHLNDLADEGIIEIRGTNPMYYGFVGVKCEFRKRCKPKPIGGDLCDKFAVKCQRRERYLDEAAGID